jgi:hypothetical protein
MPGTLSGLFAGARLALAGRGSGGGGAAAPPSPPLANLAAWYSKGTGITSAGGAVSAWADQSGNARHLVQATGSKQPALQGDGTILFDGADDFLLVDYARPQPRSCYLRVKIATFSGGRYFFSGQSTAMPSLRQGGASPAIYASAGADLGPNNNLTLAAWHSVANVFDGASSSLKVDATAATTGNPGAGGGTVLILGAANSGFSGWINMQVAAYLEYSVAHDAAAQATVMAYLDTL